MYTAIIKNGTIVDGSGAASYVADIGIKGDKIAMIGDLSDSCCDVVIDAKGQLVTPGFIDPHSHADMNIHFNPENLANLHQGITTFIGGNCGMSVAPIGEKRSLDTWDDYYIKDSIVTSYYDVMPGKIETKKYFIAYQEVLGKDITYSDLSSFYGLVKKERIATNYCPLVGHNNLRLLVMGDDANREATDEEVNKMKLILKEEMSKGALGLSTGLDYPPGAFASKEEVLELASVLKEFNGIYASHIRGRKLFVNGEGGYDVIGGINEVINIGKTHDIKVHVSHLTGMGQEKEIMTLINQGIESGVDLSFDVISNVTGGGFMFYGLMTLLRPWFNVAGTTEQLLKNLRDASYREYVIKDMQTSKWFYTNEKALPGIEGAILITQCKEEKYLNKTVKDIMAEFDMNYQETLLSIIEADPYTKMKYGREPQKELFKNLMIFMEHEMGMPSTDTFSANFDTMFGGKSPMDMLTHQNNYCTFSHYLINMKSPSIEETIRKSTNLVAERFGISNRGLLKEGYFADVLVIDMEALDTNESLLDTRQKPAGITHVFVNGILTIEDSEYIGSRAGDVLLKESNRHE